MTDEFMASMGLLAAAYAGRFPLTKEVARGWWHFFAATPPAAFLAAVEAWVSAEREPPTVADLRERLANASGEDAETAWRWVIRQVMHGRYREPGFHCAPAIEDAVRTAGGWTAIGQTAEDELHYRKRDFVTALKIVAQRERAAALLGGPPREELGDGRD